MKMYKVLRLLTHLVTAIFILVSILFGTIVTYQLKPSWFNIQKEKVASDQWKPKSIETDLPEGSEGKRIKYGYLLVTESSRWMGPLVKNPDLQYTGNNLACSNCHLQAGLQAGSAAWVGVTHRFPHFQGRENKMGSLEDRINGCMERSMNGRKLPKDSRQMEAIVAYMEWLSEDVPEDREKEFAGFPSLKIPEVAADLLAGKAVCERECQLCHGKDGQGVWFSEAAKGYQYPPLWGNDSYNQGAGMNRVLTAARFIKGNMPFGQATHKNPKLTDEEAYHVAAYIDSFERPLKENSEADFPDRKLKPVSTPYGPWADNFSPEQHKYGPFPPIMAYYKEMYGITKTN